MPGLRVQGEGLGETSAQLLQCFFRLRLHTESKRNLRPKPFGFLEAACC